MISPRSVALVASLLLLSSVPASAQTVRTKIDKISAFGVQADGATLWTQELDGDPRTREGLLVRSRPKDGQMEFLPVGTCLAGGTRRAARWIEPFELAWPHLPHEFFIVGWIATAGDRDVFAVQGIFGGYVEITFDLPACDKW